MPQQPPHWAVFLARERGLYPCGRRHLSKTHRPRRNSCAQCFHRKQCEAAREEHFCSCPSQEGLRKSQSSPDLRQLLSPSSPDSTYTGQARKALSDSLDIGPSERPQTRAPHLRQRYKYAHSSFRPLVPSTYQRVLAWDRRVKTPHFV